jgi:hypothetical protein
MKREKGLKIFFFYIILKKMDGKFIQEAEIED